MKHFTPSPSFFPKLLLVGVFTLSGCVTGFDGKEWGKAMKGIRELNESTRQIEEATFRHKQEAYYDQQLRRSK